MLLTREHRTFEERQREIERLQNELNEDTFKDDGRVFQWYVRRLLSGAADC